MKLQASALTYPKTLTPEHPQTPTGHICIYDLYIYTYIHTYMFINALTMYVCMHIYIYTNPKAQDPKPHTQAYAIWPYTL